MQLVDLPVDTWEREYCLPACLGGRLSVALLASDDDSSPAADRMLLSLASILKSFVCCVKDVQ